jgi:ABC-2 type transport system ATP-binding protein
MENTAIEIRNLTIDYKSNKKTQTVVNDLSLKVLNGEIVGFIGPNGAGKTTSIKALLDFIPVPENTCFISGIPSSNPESRRQLGYMPEISYYPKYLTMYEFVKSCAAVSGVSHDERHNATVKVIERVGMISHMKSRLSNFSKGMLQQAGCAQALVHNPDILILDEPMSGLDPIARMKMRELLTELRAEGKTILFSSHELSEIELVADKVIILNKGHSVFQGCISDTIEPGHNLEQAFIKLLGEE